MLQDFKDNIDKNFPFLFEKKLLIAVSAGVDSMVLSNLCLSLNLNISLLFKYKFESINCNLSPGSPISLLI